MKEKASVGIGQAQTHIFMITARKHPVVSASPLKIHILGAFGWLSG